MILHPIKPNQIVVVLTPQDAQALARACAMAAVDLVSADEAEALARIETLGAALDAASLAAAALGHMLPETVAEVVAGVNG